jgi:hypothetical protein
MPTFEYLVIVALRLILRRLINPSSVGDTNAYNVWALHANVFLDAKDDKNEH